MPEQAVGRHLVALDIEGLQLVKRLGVDGKGLRQREGLDAGAVDGVAVPADLLNVPGALLNAFAEELGATSAPSA